MSISEFKVFNDPLYGLISFPSELIYELVDHPYFQRLRRISQVGLSSLVYPGATHTRFQHAIGSAYLSTVLIDTLRKKGVTITDEEYAACCIAALFHDIGHGPYSHALEYELINSHHEKLTLTILNLLNDQYGGRLNLAIEIFTGTYKKKFLHQLLSSQLDIDRMDYLNRDSYYTGVAEGIIGYDRIIKMMNVIDNELVVEEKGKHSVEKFLLSRYMMYGQVYLHKTALGAEKMLIAFINRYKELAYYTRYDTILDQLLRKNDSPLNSEKINLFVKIDDSDITNLLKKHMDDEDKIISYLARGLIHRRLFRTVIKNVNINSDFVKTLRQKTAEHLETDMNIARHLVLTGETKKAIYNYHINPIKIWRKTTNQVVPFTDVVNKDIFQYQESLKYLCYPKEIG